MNLSAGVRTDVGRVRTGNEDSYFVDPPLFVIADGMGGHAAGDIASATAVEVVQSKRDEISAAAPETLSDVVRAANRAIWSRSENESSLRGMGTTCTMILVDEDRAEVAHVGDSRAYVFRAGELRQVTDDHTLVGRLVREGKLAPEDAAHHPQRSMITRALGVDQDVEVDQFSLDLAAGDRLVICSDGLSGMVSEDDIATLLGEETDPQRAADLLVDRANDAGGEDNITVIVIDVGGDASAAPAAGPGRSEPAPRAMTDPGDDTGYHRAVEVAPKRGGWARRLLVAFLVLGVIGGGGLYAARYALDNSWFVGVDETGVVTIYRGIPDEVAGLTLKEVHQRSMIELTQLPSFKRDEVEEGIKVDTLDDAQATIDDLETLARDEDFQSSMSGAGGRVF